MLRGDFKGWVQKVLPAVYDESLSYQDLLYKIIHYLDSTMNEVDGLNENFIEFKNWFKNLDVQDNINIKLDEMVQNGTLDNIISSYINPYFINFNNSLNEQNSRINALSSGAPIPVNNINQMTDTSKIYLLISSGYWYYYNGKNWISGGIYQASQSTDEIINIKNFLVNNNLKNLIEIVKGDLNANGVVSSNYRLCSNSILYFDKDIYIPQNLKIKCFIWYYDDALGTNPRGIGWVSSDKRSVTIKKHQYFRVLFDFIDENDEERTIITNPYTSNLYKYIECYYYYDYQNNIIDNYKKESLDNLKYSLLLDVGDINASTAEPTNTMQNNRRLMTHNIIKFDFDLLIPQRKENEIGCVYLYTYNNALGTTFNKIGYINKNSNYIIPKNTYFRLLITDYDSNSINPVGNLFTSNIFNNFKIYKYSESFLINYNKNITSVAHQGYSGYIGVINHSLLDGYSKAKIHGFEFGETDLKFTSDNIPVCCHDNSFSSGGESIIISEHTLKELKSYTYYGGEISTLDEILSECKKIGLGLYLDHLYTIDNDTKWNNVFNIIKKYSMEDNIKWLCNAGIQRLNYQTNKILTWYKKSKISIVTSENDLTNIIINANNLKTDYNEVTIDCLYSNFTIEQLINYNTMLYSGVKIELWTIDNIET